MPWEKQFDHDEALSKAMGAFWAHGYEATSMQDLVDCMGVNRGSLYATFGAAIGAVLDAGSCDGCLMVNTALELSPHDEEVSAITDSAPRIIEANATE